MKTKLKKLELRKSRIVELNDIESGQIKGGSTMACVYGSATIVASVVTAGQELSWWACEPQPSYVTCVADQDGCQITEVVVKP